MERSRRILPILLGLSLVIALFCFRHITASSNQAMAPKPMPISFSGEYSTDGIYWLALDMEDLPAVCGSSLMLRGHFSETIPEGGYLNYYRDHVGVCIYRNGERIAMDTVCQLQSLGLPLMDAVCGREWYQFSAAGITPEDEVEIHLMNPHGFSLRSSCETFLKTLCVTDQGTLFLRENLEPHGNYLRIVGTVMTVVAVMLLGAALAAWVLRIPVGSPLVIRSGLVLFAGGFFYFDTIDIQFFSPLLVTNSYGWQLSIMLWGLFLCWCIADSLSGKYRKTGMLSLLLLAAANSALFLSTLFRSVVLYDTVPLWAVVQFFVLTVLTVCSYLSCKASGEKQLLLTGSAAASLLALGLDLLGAGESVLSRLTCCKVIFLLLFCVHMVDAFARVVRNYRASQRIQKLEKELESSRIAVMLSQIRPHFLFNSLGAIQELCHSEPAAAEAAIEKFALYLRGNMTALTTDKLIPFPEEMNHVLSYLELEQLRFGDQLEVKLDITATAFHLPVLTIQPMVENAVRHGVRKNENGGWVRISTREADNRWIVTVEDNGPGFSSQPENPEQPHVGIQNVRLRLQEMCAGTLTIDSDPLSGTCVTVAIPKEGTPC